MRMDRAARPSSIKRLFPKYTRIEWLLLAAMGAMIIVVPLALSPFFPLIARYSIFALFVSCAVNAFFWQDPRFMSVGYRAWISTFVLGAIIAAVGPYTHALHMVIMTGTMCMYAAPWSLLRLFLRKKFLSAN